MDEKVEEVLTFIAEEEHLSGGNIITFDSSEEGQAFNFETYDGNSAVEMNPDLVLYYDWLADCATTSHVSNRRDVFTSYHAANDTIVHGVGDV
jgi:hypothetical protein